MKKRFLFVILALCLLIVGCGKDSKKESTETDSKEETKEVAPYESTEELIESMEKITAKKITDDTIEFDDSIKLEEGDKVALWLYSAPKFLGYFEVKSKDNAKIIEGIAAALTKLDVEYGVHNIGFVAETGDEIGYIGIYIREEGGMIAKEDARITKEETVTEEIKYTTKKQNDASILSGKTEISQKGENGTKEVTYKITYDADGKELKKEKISEKVTKKAKEEIIKVGTADVKIGDKTGGIIAGEVCETPKVQDGVSYCDSTGGYFSNQAFVVNGVPYLFMINSKKINKAVKLTKSGSLYEGNYNGKKIYFYENSGETSDGTLTKEDCTKYALTCAN